MWVGGRQARDAGVCRLLLPLHGPRPTSQPRPPARRRPPPPSSGGPQRGGPALAMPRRTHQCRTAKCRVRASSRGGRLRVGGPAGGWVERRGGPKRASAFVVPHRFSNWGVGGGGSSGAHQQPPPPSPTQAHSFQQQQCAGLWARRAGIGGVGAAFQKNNLGLLQGTRLPPPLPPSPLLAHLPPLSRSSARPPPPTLSTRCSASRAPWAPGCPTCCPAPRPSPPGSRTQTPRRMPPQCSACARTARCGRGGVAG